MRFSNIVYKSRKWVTLGYLLYTMQKNHPTFNTKNSHTLCQSLYYCYKLADTYRPRQWTYSLKNHEITFPFQVFCVKPVYKIIRFTCNNPIKSCMIVLLVIACVHMSELIKHWTREEKRERDGISVESRPSDSVQGSTEHTESKCSCYP